MCIFVCWYFLFVARSSSWLRQHLANATSVVFDIAHRAEREEIAELRLQLIFSICHYVFMIANWPSAPQSSCPPVCLSLCLSVSQSVSAIVIDVATKKKNSDLLSSEECDHVGLATLGLAWPKARNFDCKLICSNCQQQRREIAAGAATEQQQQQQQPQLLIVYNRFVFWAKFVRVSVVALSDFDNCMRSIDLPASQFVRGFCLSILGLVLANLLKVA